MLCWANKIRHKWVNTSLLHSYGVQKKANDLQTLKTQKNIKSKIKQKIFVVLFCFVLFSTTPAAYGSSHTRGQIGATAAGLHYSHSNAGSELRPRPTPQVTAMLDP